MSECKTEKKSAELEAAELAKVKAEAKKAKVDAKKAKHDLKMERFYDKRRLHEFREKDAIDERNGVFYMNSGISGASVKVCREFINEWRRVHPGQPITLVLNSPGGSVFDGFDLMDCIAAAKDAGHTVTTEIAGMAASMAGVIAQLGTERIIGRYSRLHLHEVSTGTIGKLSDIKDTAELAESLTRSICEVYADRARATIGDAAWSADAIFEWIDRQERWLTADEALAMGFVDRIA